uniref:ATP-dependent DNA helicase n=1 Tax=Lactuca sativa TaxID=4236 RepID=A0A9R1VL20_LACSA|nr:hypothetical protein LSAT_V11C500249600 [Lactuca sativa]
MTINKSQGQSLRRIGVYLPQPMFSHGQLYIALSRATSPDSIKILIQTNNPTQENHTKNVVFKDLMQKVATTEVYLKCHTFQCFSSHTTPYSHITIRLIRVHFFQTGLGVPYKLGYYGNVDMMSDAMKPGRCYTDSWPTNQPELYRICTKRPGMLYNIRLQLPKARQVSKVP